jgi:polyhydroxybutyrate depolymerase
LFVLHGGGGGGPARLQRVGFNEIAEEAGFLVVYPEGVGSQWNDGRGARFGRRDGDTDIDDVGFIVAVLDAVADEFPVDRDRVYVTGASNGAMMTHRLLIEAGDAFAAGAAVIGNLARPLAGAAPPESATPLLLINGTDDRLVPFDGGVVAGRTSYGEVVSVGETVAFWRAANGCAGSPMVERLPDLDRWDGSVVRRETHACDEAPLVLYVVEGGGHQWPLGPESPRWVRLLGCNRDIDATRLIWEFVSQFRRN